MRIFRNALRSVAVRIILAFLVIGACTGRGSSPVEAPDGLDRHIRLAFIGEMAVKILIDTQPLMNPTQAARLRVDMVIDAGRPTFDGNNLTKTVEIGPALTQASIVKEWNGSGSYEGNVYYDDLWGVVTPGTFRGTVADGDYTVKLYRDGTTLVSSKTIAVNHPNTGGTNGSFLDESSDQRSI